MTLLHQAAQKAVEALKLADGALCQASPCMWKDCKQEQMEWLAAARESIATNLAALESALQQQPEPVALATQIEGLRAVRDMKGGSTHPDNLSWWRLGFEECRAQAAQLARVASPSTTRQQEVSMDEYRRVVARCIEMGEKIATRQQEVGSDIVEAIARQWDGCMVPMFDATGNPTDALDIGATIRADGIPAAAGWRPIATVPKDGREIILREGSRVGAACWVEWPDTHDNDGAPNSDGGEGWTVGYDGNEWRNPTAWQPLPAAPSTPENDHG